jgi:hypothetical protein
MKKIQGVLAILFVVLLLITGAYAGSDQAGQDNAGMPPPPPSSGNFTGAGKGAGNPPPSPKSAIEACSGKAQGTVCTDGKMEGVCEYTPDKKFFACRPNFRVKPGGDNSQEKKQPPQGMGQNSKGTQE